MKYIIYMHKLINDNRVYIGMTKQKPQKRWQNGLGYTHSSYFYNAIKKYGWNNFEHIILFKNLSKEEAEAKEKELIKKYKSNIKGFGFNINDGGNCAIMTEEQKKKISNSEKGKIISAETIEKIKKSKKERYFKYGLTQRQQDFYKRKSKPIICIENGNIYQNQADLKKNGFNSANVCMVCYGKRKTASGLHWNFCEE